jgi:hypothetical protein
MSDKINKKDKLVDLAIALFTGAVGAYFSYWLSTLNSAPQPITPVMSTPLPSSNGNDFFTISNSIASPLITIGAWIAGLFALSMGLRILAIFEIFDAFDHFDDLGDLFH